MKNFTCSDLSLYMQSKLFQCLSFQKIKTLKKPLRSFHQAVLLLPSENFLVCLLSQMLERVEHMSSLFIGCHPCAFKNLLAFLENRDRNREMSSVSES